jgi:hypothetical protein
MHTRSSTPTPGAERVLSEDAQIRVMHDHRRESQRLGQQHIGDMWRPAREIREDEGAAVLVGERSRDRHHRARHLGRDAGDRVLNQPHEGFWAIGRRIDPVTEQLAAIGVEDGHSKVRPPEVDCRHRVAVHVAAPSDS